jgi:hypothetical protein
MEVKIYLMAKAPSKTSKAVTKPYEPTEKEAVQLAAIQSRKDAKPPALKVDLLIDDGTARLSLGYDDQAVGEELITAALGSTDLKFAKGILQQVGNAAPRIDDLPDPKAFDFMLSAVVAVQPRDSRK